MGVAELWLCACSPCPCSTHVAPEIEVAGSALHDPCRKRDATLWAQAVTSYKHSGAGAAAGAQCPPGTREAQATPRCTAEGEVAVRQWPRQRFAYSADGDFQPFRPLLPSLLKSRAIAGDSVSRGLSTDPPRVPSIPGVKPRLPQLDASLCPSSDYDAAEPESLKEAD
ncbi:hypothetical protein H920_18558 [Fukomys damarensis]|uniref:Uncharacterized protein n=1 Tax=Fukomys damarensis TaxID=885580 RepID=A0A091CPP1_FUKDA|nr:hypothetical protein H920_18558 [Fukomys damarensis]